MGDVQIIRTREGGGEVENNLPARQPAKKVALKAS